MKIDLHIHSKDCSDGKMSLPDIFAEADRRQIKVISIADHDSIQCQESAKSLAARYGMYYITGVELNISFSHPRFREGRPVSLDVLGYQYDMYNRALQEKLSDMRHYRRIRAERILEKINEELAKEQQQLFTDKDLKAIEETVDGAFGRPHIADYMVTKGLVRNRQEAFDRYLVRCNVPKHPLTLEEASVLIRTAGGKLMLAHPNDPNGTSLVALTESLEEQHRIIMESMLNYLDGIECWHSRHDQDTTSAYAAFCASQSLMRTGGSDCHQQPVIMGTVAVPLEVVEQFGLKLKE